MSDRAVSLDLRTLAGDGGGLPSQHHSAREAPNEFDHALAERFSAALFGARPEPETAPDAPLENAFTLLRTLGEAGAADLASQRDALAPFDDAAGAATGADLRGGAARVAMLGVPFADRDSAVHAGLGNEAPMAKGSEHAARAIEMLPAALPLMAPIAASGETNSGDQPPPDRGHREQLLQTLTEMASRLAVGDASSGERTVRVELTDSALPGVSVSVYLAFGEWVADFTCTVQASFEILAGEASSMAQQLSDMLRAPACWLVAMNPPLRDPVEARAMPGRTLTE